MSADKERCDGWRKSPCLSHLGNLKYFLIVAVHFGQTEMGQKEWLSAGLGPPIRPGRWFSNVIGPFGSLNPGMRLCKSSPELRILLSCSLAWPRMLPQAMIGLCLAVGSP
jgi:hypothetical protein